MYKNIIWDFDGTLFDTYPSITRALQGACGEMGIDIGFADAYALAKTAIGQAIGVLASRFGVDADALKAAYERLNAQTDLSRLRM